MPIEFVVNDELTAAVQQVIGEFSEFSPIRDNSVLVRACLKVKHNRDHEVVPAGDEAVKVSLINECHRLFMQFHYLLVVDNYDWAEAGPDGRRALIHKALMHIDVTVDDDGTNFKVRKPTVREFPETIRRFGFYSADLRLLEQAIRDLPAMVAPLPPIPAQAVEQAQVPQVPTIPVPRAPTPRRRQREGIEET